MRYWNEPNSPLFPFGHGLSYTRFAYANLRPSDPRIAVGDHLKVSVDVTNTGPRAGDEVVQLYIHQRHGTSARPVKELKGFQRITLAPGETRTVTFPLTPDHLRYWSSATRDWVQDATTFDVFVGGSSEDTLQTTFEVV